MENQSIEPEFYLPIIPMVLVNGADCGNFGEGYGKLWYSKIPKYNPRELAENLKRMLEGNDPLPMQPWFKNFGGTIQDVGEGEYVAYGEIVILNDNEVEINELPVSFSTQSYKEYVLEPLMKRTKNRPILVTDYKEYHTDTTVQFVISMTSESFAKARAEGFHKFFKLETTISLDKMFAFNSQGVLRRYENVEEILKEFFELRLSFYAKRKAYLAEILQTKGAKDELLKKGDENRQELEILRGKTPMDLWREDLDMFLKELDMNEYEKEKPKMVQRVAVSERCSVKKKKAPARKAPPKKTAVASVSEDVFSDDSSKKKKAPAKKTASDSEDDFSSKPKKGGKRKMVDSDDDLNILDDPFQHPPRATTGRGKK